MEVLLVYFVLKNDEVMVMFEFHGQCDWIIYDTGDSGFLIIIYLFIIY